MALREEFVQTGNWLFRRRSYLPLVFFVIYLPVLNNFNYLGFTETSHHLWEIFCLLISSLGLTIRILTIGHTPSGTSGRNTKAQVAKTLNTTGMYSIVRNPLYLGNFFMWLGIALFVHVWWIVLIFILMFWLYYERIIFAEEEFLREKFGNDYLQWANKTPAFIPKFRLYKKPAYSFSMKTVLKREYNGLLAMSLIFFFLDILGDFFYKNRLDVDVEWIIFTGIIFILWITLRILKKKTKLLNVNGR